VNKAKQLWRTQYKDKVFPTANTTGPDLEPDVFEQNQLVFNKVDDEFDTFIAATLNLIACSALDWCPLPDQQHNYPNLQRMAINIHSILSMSAEPE
jgi:hypothetical protein